MLFVFSEEGSAVVGLPIEAVGAASGLCVTDGDGVIKRGGNRNNINTPNVERINITRKIFLTVFNLFSNYGFFLKRTSTKFDSQSLDKLISIASDKGKPA